MSLISDALKKAQRQRTIEAGGGADGPRIVVRRGSDPSKQVFLIAGALVLVVVAAAVFVVLKLRPSEEEIAARVTAEAAKAREAAAAKVVASPPAASPAPGKAGDTTPLIVLNVPSSGQAAAPLAPPPERPVLVPPAAPAAPPPGAPSPALQDYVETLRITGWSAAGAPAERKVMINERVYRINDVVDRALGLKLVEIQSDGITFADERGGTYPRRL
jgi:hypothetical protein